MEKKLSIMGFKIKMNAKYKVAKGYERSFYQCDQCRHKVYNDFIPYSFGVGIVTTPCGHDFRIHYKNI